MLFPAAADFYCLFFWSGDLCLPMRDSNRCRVDWVAFGSVASSVAVIAAACAAFLGLHTWRHEQRASLAMEMLSLIHEGVAKIRAALSPQSIANASGVATVNFDDRDAIMAYQRERMLLSARHFRETALQDSIFWARLEAMASKVRALFSDGWAYPLERLVALRSELLDLAYLVKAFEEHLARGGLESNFAICGDLGSGGTLERARALFPCELRSSAFSREYFGETEVSGGSFSEDFVQFRKEIETLVTLSRAVAFGVFEKEWSRENSYRGPG